MIQAQFMIQAHNETRVSRKKLSLSTTLGDLRNNSVRCLFKMALHLSRIKIKNRHFLDVGPLSTKIGTVLINTSLPFSVFFRAFLLAI
jgi:hypothetical protein